MKFLLILVGFALALVIGLSIYADTLVKKVERRQKEVQERFDVRVASLRALREPEGSKPFVTFDEAEFEVWLKVRSKLATLLERRFAEEAAEKFWHRLETRELSVVALEEGLTEAKMSLEGYRARSQRWLSLLARDDPPGMLAEWRKAVATRDAPRGPPMPPEAVDATEAEKALLLKQAARLRETFAADLLNALLDEIAD